MVGSLGVFEERTEDLRCEYAKLKQTVVNHPGKRQEYVTGGICWVIRPLARGLCCFKAFFVY